MQAVADLGYRVNVQARHLASGSGRQLALVYATDIDAEPNSYYHSGLELGAMRACAETGYSLSTHTVNSQRAGDRGRIVELGRQRYDGLILTPPFSDDVALIEALREIDCPVLCISAGPAARSVVPWVGIDDRQAGFELGAYLVGLGHRRFGYIDGLAGHASAGLRAEGFADALGEAGLASDAMTRYRGNFTFKSGVEISAEILSRPDRPTALVCANDDMAAGALLSAHKFGLQIPGDISITGFDDTPVSEIVWPPLTTIHQPLRQIGAKAVELLVASIEKRAEPPLSANGHYVPFRLVERLSTAPAA